MTPGEPAAARGLPAVDERDKARQAGRDERDSQVDKLDEQDGGRREIDVKPEEVWQPSPIPEPRWAHRSFFAPIVLVVAISAALVYGAVLLLGGLWAWLR